MTADDVVGIRPGRRADLPALVGLAGSDDRAAWRVHAAEAGTEVLLVAERDGAVVGTVSVQREGRCDPPHPWLYGLHVRAQVRRAGIGTALVRAAEDAVGRLGATAVSLDVDRDEDHLVAWYRRLGYTTVGPHEHRWRAVDPATGEVTAEGTAATWLMRRTVEG